MHYLILNILVFLVPFYFTFHKDVRFYRYWREIIFAILIPGIFFIIWDVLFTKWGIWGFNPHYLIGLEILNLPVEEILFFLCIPYACLFSYFIIKKFIKFDPFDRYSKPFTWLLIAVLLITGFIFVDKYYTGFTFIITSVFLFFHRTMVKQNYISKFYLTYSIIFLLPFIIVNGYLTGSFTDEPIVWYNNSHNLLIRILTIPIEDFVYGFLLFLMNVTLFEKAVKFRKLKLQNNWS